MQKIAGKILIVAFFLLVLHADPVQAAGTFSINPASGSYVRGCTQSAAITTSITSGESNAADIILTYDTTKIEILDALPSIPGTQILPGNAYESYAGNSVNTTTGEIKLVGYSASSTLTGTATFATIYYRSKPLASNGGFTITMTGVNPYNTLDSNIADAATSYDMLSGVTNAAYTFVSGTCATDTTSPNIAFISPKNLQNNVLPDASVTVKLEDLQSGISLPSLQIIINGTIYTSSNPEVSISGTPASYTVNIVPSLPFPTNSVSVISVSVSDTAGNERTSSISINSGYSCPVVTITKPEVCPSQAPARTTDRTSPTVTVSADTVIDVRKDFKLTITVKDTQGISPNSFSMQIGTKTFTLSSTPDRITLTGNKTEYTYEVLLKPDEMQPGDDGTLVAVVKISDLEGNTRIQNLLFRTTGGKNAIKPPPSTPSVSSILTTAFETVVVYLARYVAPAAFFTYLLTFVVLNTLPTIAEVHDDKNRPIRFPHGYLLFSNGARQTLHGSYDGKLHGRIPREATTLVIQKYGFTTLTYPLHSSMKYEVKKVSIRKL